MTPAHAGGHVGYLVGLALGDCDAVGANVLSQQLIYSPFSFGQQWYQGSSNTDKPPRSGSTHRSCNVQLLAAVGEDDGLAVGDAVGEKLGLLLGLAVGLPDGI